ncbi:type II toxin-antitoxin system VapC family toxin [Pimelobacter simplex]|uniref:Type II toxin-antitoxin system VapC family toxin n=1 Tax=Nocardioides simplex TaxID=2045 RepID=A0A7J5DSK3_NOCSI|nr:PIN domain-containing protein [Pimelobacter simplex]KAB2807972.1 type II toxin-antitoxin system VapC family toxin [Pimelobacter simplex]
MYFDTCVYLAVMLPGEPGAREAAAALSAAERGATLGHTSALVVAEAIGNSKLRAPQGMPKPARDKRLDQARDYFLASDFRYVDITARAGTLAMQYAVDFQLAGPDSLHLALASVSGCDQLFTFDKGLLDVGSRVPGLIVCKPFVDQSSIFDDLLDDDN